MQIISVAGEAETGIVVTGIEGTEIEGTETGIEIGGGKWNSCKQIFFPPPFRRKARRHSILAWEFVTRSCLKPQNPCSNHEIHVLFEHGFYLKKPKLRPDLHA